MSSPNNSRIVALVAFLSFTLPGAGITSASLGAQAAPCVSLNWGGSLRNRTATASIFAFQESNGPTMRAVKALEMYTMARSTTQTVTFSIWDSAGPHNGGKVLASGTVQMTTTLQPWKVTFPTPAILPANTNYWVGFDRGTQIYMPTVLPGTSRTHYYYQSSRWYGPYSGTWNYRLYCADMAEVGAYGQGCTGSKPGCVAAGSSNWTDKLANLQTAVKKVGVMDFGVSGSNHVCGFEMRCRSITGTVKVTVTAHDINWSTSTPLPGTQLGTATVNIGTTEGAYLAPFAKSFAPPASGAVMFIFDQADKIVLPASSTGTLGYHIEFDGAKWSSMLGTKRWAYRIHRTPPAAVPQIAAQGRPKLGSQFSILLSRAKASSASLFVLGGSQTRWGPLPLPLDLKPLGAPGCLLLTSTDLALTVPTDGQGNAKVTLAVPMASSLVGKHFFCQFMVYDPGANALNLVSSPGIDAKVGRY